MKKFHSAFIFTAALIEFVAVAVFVFYWASKHGHAQPVAPASAAASAPVELTPNTACGAPGTGIDFDGVRRTKTQAMRRVDDSGKWIECDRPCYPLVAEAFRTWSEGDQVCTTFDRYASGANDPRRDRVLRHGELGVWEQWLGPKRGRLHERCDDGKRIVSLSTCAPAKDCSARFAYQGFVYDGRRQPVPLGRFAMAVSEYGEKLRIQCADGRFEIAPQCLGGQQVSRLFGPETRIYRYAGDPVDVGGRVTAQQVAVIQKDGTTITDPSQFKNKIRITIAACGPAGRLQ